MALELRPNGTVVVYGTTGPICNTVVAFVAYIGPWPSRSAGPLHAWDGDRAAGYVMFPMLALLAAGLLLIAVLLLTAQDLNAGSQPESAIAVTREPGRRLQILQLGRCLDALREVATLRRQDVSNELVAGAATAPDTWPELRRDAGGRLIGRG